jgi:BirA family biotin operon repressor/biotin-[acetyl-CoA-carboxylase] ligase
MLEKLKIKNIFLKKIDSTQNFAKENFKSFKSDVITCITAEEQTRGRGRFKRVWHSPKGNLYTTFYLKLPSKIRDITSLGEILTLSLLEVLEKENLKDLKISWPNDILISDKKVSGVLCEIIFKAEEAHLFLGIGVNVNMDEKNFSLIEKKATSLKCETKKVHNSKKLLKKLQKRFLKNLKIFLKKGFFPFREKFEKSLKTFKKSIEIFDGQNRFIGILDSIKNTGELNLKLESGEIKTFSSGDISFSKKT